MITTLDKNRLNGERMALINEVSEESRLANITGKQAVSIVSLICDKHDECIEVLKGDPEADIDEVITAYRGLIRKVLKKI